MPMFGYGCAVFMQSDIVNFQRQGWAPEEILAGLAAVLPKNIFLYVASIPNLAKLGTRFVLQGGTQHNLAAVKAEVDFIRSNFRGAGLEPEIIVHEHCGESGAIGAAVEARAPVHERPSHPFIGLDAVRRSRYRTTRNEATRCNFCKNNCLRTFIDIKMGRRLAVASCAGMASGPEMARAPLRNPAHREGPAGRPVKFVSKVAKADDEQRFDHRDLREGHGRGRRRDARDQSGLDEMKKANPNFVEIAAKEAFWNPRQPESVADPIPHAPWTKAARRADRLMQRRESSASGCPAC